MYGIKEVGKYNIDFEGLSYDGNIPYEMVIMEIMRFCKQLERLWRI